MKTDGTLVGSKISANSVALAGEFAVLSRLALHGYDANMTLGRTKNVDILVSDPKTNKAYQLEVKTIVVKRKQETSVSKLFGRFVCDWIMNEKHEAISRPQLWYCFVMIIIDTKQMRFFVVPSKQVADYVKATHRLWLDDSPKHRDNVMRLFRIGLKGEKYKVPTPVAEHFEDNWSFATNGNRAIHLRRGPRG